MRRAAEQMDHDGVLAAAYMLLKEPLSPPERAEVLYHVAANLTVGRDPKAVDRAQEALAAAEAAGAAVWQVRSQAVLGRAYLLVGDWHLAAEHLEPAIAVAREGIEHRHQLPFWLGWLALARRRMKRAAEAVALMDEALAIHVSRLDYRPAAYMAAAIATYYLAEKQVDAAWHYIGVLEQLAAYDAEARDYHGIVRAWALFESGNPQAAMGSLTGCGEPANPELQALRCYVAARIARVLLGPQAARDLANQAIDLSVQARAQDTLRLAQALLAETP
jgi:tetratricopeptide (TPR) repeat protein